MFTMDTPTPSCPEDSEEVVCFFPEQLSGMDPDWASSVLKQASLIPQEDWPWEQAEVEGRGEGGRERGKKGRGFWFILPRTEEKQMIYRYYANVSTSCQPPTVRRIGGGLRCPPELKMLEG